MISLFRSNLYVEVLTPHLVIVLVCCGIFYAVSLSTTSLLMARQGRSYEAIWTQDIAPRLSETIPAADRDALRRSLRNVDEELELGYLFTLNMAVLWSVSLATFAAVGVSIFTTKRIALPLDTMCRISERIATGRYHERLNDDYPGKLGELSRAFNIMAEALEKIEHKRVELIGNISHEFKTPLSSLRGHLEGISDGIFQADDETMQICLRQVSRLENLMQDLSLLSRLETGEEKVAISAVDVSSLFAHIAQTFKLLFEQRAVTLHIHYPPQLLMVQANADRSVQVLSNLLSNALRHTPEGGNVHLRVEEKNRLQLLFSVCDDGEGISDEDLPHIFSRFYRADKARHRSDYAGSGIGLTITRHYVEMQGGTIEVESELGKGSCFRFTLLRS